MKVKCISMSPKAVNVRDGRRKFRLIGNFAWEKNFQEFRYWIGSTLEIDGGMFANAHDYLLDDDTKVLVKYSMKLPCSNVIMDQTQMLKAGRKRKHTADKPVETKRRKSTMSKHSKLPRSLNDISKKPPHILVGVVAKYHYFPNSLSVDLIDEEQPEHGYTPLRIFKVNSEIIRHVGALLYASANSKDFRKWASEKSRVMVFHTEDEIEKSNLDKDIKDELIQRFQNIPTWFDRSSISSQFAHRISEFMSGRLCGDLTAKIMKKTVHSDRVAFSLMDGLSPDDQCSINIPLSEKFIDGYKVGDFIRLGSIGSNQRFINWSDNSRICRLLPNHYDSRKISQISTKPNNQTHQAPLPVSRPMPSTRKNEVTTTLLVPKETKKFVQNYRFSQTLHPHKDREISTISQVVNGKTPYKYRIVATLNDYYPHDEHFFLATYEDKGEWHFRIGLYFEGDLLAMVDGEEAKKFIGEEPCDMQRNEKVANRIKKKLKSLIRQKMDVCLIKYNTHDEDFGPGYKVFDTEVKFETALSK